MTEQNPRADLDTKQKPAAKASRGSSSPRTLHVVVHTVEGGTAANFSDAIIHGQELDALRSIVGKANWHYVTVRPGESIAEALKQ